MTTTKAYPSYCARCINNGRNGVVKMLTGYSMKDATCDGCGRTADLAMVEPVPGQEPIRGHVRSDEPIRWHVANGNEVIDRWPTFDGNGARTGDTPNRICVVEYPYADAAGQHANAALIAAAPELLAAAETALVEMVTLVARLPDPYRKNLQSAIDQIKTVLAKARP